MNPEQEKILHQAKELDQAHDWQRSAELWLDLSQQVDQPEIMVKAVNALYEAQRYQEAYQQILMCLQEHPDTAINLSLLVKIYLATNHYISIRMIIMQQADDQQTILLKKVAQAEAKYRSQFQETLKNHLRTFYHLGDCPIHEQQSRLTAADQLPLNEFLTGCQFLLRDPFTNPFVRAELLNILQRLKYDQSIVMLCIDNHEHSLIPVGLPSAYEMPSIQKCRQLIQQKFANADPQMANALNQQLDLQAILLNPITEQIIKEPKQWLQVMITRALNPSLADLNHADHRWQDKINQIIAKIQ